MSTTIARLGTAFLLAACFASCESTNTSPYAFPVFGPNSVQVSSAGDMTPGEFFSLNAVWDQGGAPFAVVWNVPDWVTITGQNTASFENVNTLGLMIPASAGPVPSVLSGSVTITDQFTSSVTYNFSVPVSP
jgi:hypothetical protein